MSNEDPMSSQEFADYIQAMADQSPKEPFRPSVFYNRAGQLFEFLFEDEDYYAEWINPHLTVYKSFADNRVIGGEVTFVHDLIARTPNDG